MIQKRTNLLRAWVPLPDSLLQRFVVRDAIRLLDPRDFLDVGAGTGDIAQWMNHRGMSGVATEVSPRAIQMLHERLDKTDVQIHFGEAKEIERQFDLVLCRNVLEHIEDDDAMLRQLCDRVRPGGHLILSVPAGKRLFSDEDRRVGRLRRYERQELKQQILATGFRTAQIFSYGFPLCLLSRQVQRFIPRKHLGSDNRTAQERTEASCIERVSSGGLRWLLNDVAFFPFHCLQLPFLRVNWSDGYVAVCQKPTDKK